MNEFETNEAATAAGTEIAIEPEKKQRFSKGTLVMSALILAAVGGVALIHFRAGPATASASSETTKTVNSFFGDGKKNMATMQAVLKDTDRVVEQFRNFPAAAQVPLEDLQRNPFTSTKSDMKPAETVEASDLEARKKAGMAKAAQLKVQSIIYSETNRSCLINGKFHTVGDSINGFKILRIEPKNVVVNDGSFSYLLLVQN